MIMNAKMRIATILAALTLTFSLSQLLQSASAQSARNFFGVRGNAAASPSANSNCKKIRGNGIQMFDPLTAIVTGPVTNSGILDRDLGDVINFGAGFVFTPDPTVVAYTTNLTITTIHGQLRSNPVTIQSVVTAAGAEWGHINPNTSDGRFAGATGTISIVFKAVGDPSVGRLKRKSMLTFASLNKQFARTIVVRAP
jgi:hypothetical protein